MGTVPFFLSERSIAMSKQPLCLAPGEKIRLRDFDADYTG